MRTNAAQQFDWPPRGTDEGGEQRKADRKLKESIRGAFDQGAMASTLAWVALSVFPVQ